MEQSNIKLETSKNRAWIFASAMACLALVEAFTISGMMPLKEKIPFYVKVNDSTGEVAVSRTPQEKFTPTELNLTYFIRRFADDLLTMDAARSKKYLLPEAASFTRAGATKQYSDWIEIDKPIERLVDNPLLSRHIENFNINYIPDTDVAILRFTLVTIDNNEIKKDKKSMSIKYSLISTEMSESNPLGFFVTNFNIKDEL